MKEFQALMAFAAKDKSESMTKSILLLKGVFSSGILRCALAQKRWRVNYGLDPSRSLLAVPFNAKDTPTARSEWSHPDFCIVLTCLSYYYEGLKNDQLRACIEALALTDQAQEKYDLWVADAPLLPPAFKHVEAINLINTGQYETDIFPPLRFSKAAIDFYLANVVFPSQMKEFPHKLSASGWDIAREKSHPTTGFSGTNDSRYVLPLSIIQSDLPALLSTNASVMERLLRPENTFADSSHELSGGVFDADCLLRLALKLNARVILDVGAQVLEHNEDISRQWLHCASAHDAEAVVFFDANSNICVLTRDDVIESLVVSLFAKMLDRCLIYLDQDHTRGTDLNFPQNYKAIVTLGPGLSKDRIVQACMRMRKLGKGQSIAFCAPPEVERKILECTDRSSNNLTSTRAIQVTDVLQWCIEETCAGTRRIIPLWATQGLRHQHRCAINPGAPKNKNQVGRLREPEAQSLQQRYGQKPTITEGQDHISRTVSSQAKEVRRDQVESIRKQCTDFEIYTFSTASVLEEQERELSPEYQREQQAQHLPRQTPLQHTVSSGLRRLVTEGLVGKLPSSMTPAFDIFANSSAKKSLEQKAWRGDLLVTEDFKNVIKKTEGDLDLYIRPVRWLLALKKGKAGMVLILISPFEAQELFSAAQKSKFVTLYTCAVSLRIRHNLTFDNTRRLHNLEFIVQHAVRH